MNHAFITVSPERKLSDIGSEPKLIRTEHEPDRNYDKPFEGSVPGKAGLKSTQNFINQFYTVDA